MNPAFRKILIDHLSSKFTESQPDDIPRKAQFCFLREIVKMTEFPSQTTIWISLQFIVKRNLRTRSKCKQSIDVFYFLNKN